MSATAWVVVSVSPLAVAADKTNVRSAARMHARLRRSTTCRRRVSLASRDIYHLALAAGEGKACLSAGNLSAERKAPDATLKLIFLVKVAVPVCLRCSEWLPVATVVHE